MLETDFNHHTVFSDSGTNAIFFCWSTFVCIVIKAAKCFSHCSTKLIQSIQLCNYIATKWYHLLITPLKRFIRSSSILFGNNNCCSMLRIFAHYSTTTPIQSIETDEQKQASKQTWRKA